MPTRAAPKQRALAVFDGSGAGDLVLNEMGYIGTTKPVAPRDVVLLGVMRSEGIATEINSHEASVALILAIEPEHCAL